ncbi:putative calcium-binding protein CML41 [Salvia divinorum]|uniref:Calcium-binding protein CML41 n=1 Tax=Salvia divinorum TaxID=28513 RepID=A0ABD1I6S9_SALDI
MAIASIITKPFSSGVFKLRHLRSRPPPPTEAALPNFGSREEEFRRVFRFLDSDNDGSISADELTAYFASVGDAVSREEAERIIIEFSGGGSLLQLKFEEFVRVMDGGADVDVLRQAFEVYEEEKGSGCITAEGLRQVLRRLGHVKSVQECKDMIGVYDLDGNGVLDFHEFCKMMT